MIIFNKYLRFPLIRARILSYRVTFLSTIVLAALLLFSTPLTHVQAAASDLDLTFGTGGIVTTNFFDNGGSTVYALTVQPDGKVIAIGNATRRVASRGQDFIFYEFGLARFNSDGSLDSTF